MSTALLWILAIALIAIGIAGSVLPALPGVIFVYGGLLLAAWIDHFNNVSKVTLVVLGILAAATLVIDFVAGIFGAQRVGASKLAIIGAAIGTVAGLFAGFIGVFIGPLIGAAIGEYLARRDLLRAGQVGFATWIATLLATLIRLAVVFVMIGIFIAAYLI
jgi:uncharacterized protein YqgC (DUF456 family)